MKRARKDSAGFARCLKSKWLVDFVKLSGIMVLELSTLQLKYVGKHVIHSSPSLSRSCLVKESPSSREDAFSFHV